MFFIKWHETRKLINIYICVHSVIVVRVVRVIIIRVVGAKIMQ